MTRKEKLDRLLSVAPMIEIDYELPDNPNRFVVLEQDDIGNTMWIYFGESLDQLKGVIAESETHFVERVLIHDLDSDTVLAPVWKVEQFVEIENDFSYADGYLTIP